MAGHRFAFEKFEFCMTPLMVFSLHHPLHVSCHCKFDLHGVYSFIILYLEDGHAVGELVKLSSGDVCLEVVMITDLGLP